MLLQLFDLRVKSSDLVLQFSVFYLAGTSQHSICLRESYPVGKLDACCLLEFLRRCCSTTNRNILGRNSKQAWLVGPLRIRRLGPLSHLLRYWNRLNDSLKRVRSSIDMLKLLC